MVVPTEAGVPPVTVQLRAANAANGKYSNPANKNCNHMIFMV